MNKRFRGFLPVVVDIETSGINPLVHAPLEIAAVIIDCDDKGQLVREQTYFEHIIPFDNAEMDPKALAFNKIDPHQPLRFAKTELDALTALFLPIKAAVKKHKCQRAVLVGHNAWFDLLFLKEATKRANLKSPFHDFTCFDTATLAALSYGQTVLAKALTTSGLPYAAHEAHSAIYDAEITADLFCKMINDFDNSKA